MDNRLPKIRDEFVEKIGLIAQGEGLPRIAGRVFGLLVFDGDPIAFGDLANRLQVSRGSISSSVRILEERGLVRRMTKAGERQEFLQLAANPYVSLLEGARRRTRFARDEIRRTINSVTDADQCIRERLIAYADFYDAIDDGLSGVVHRLSTESSD